MPRALLVQPRSGGRISGGYLYNAKMAAHGAWDLVDLDARELEQNLRRDLGALVLADSIWLTERTFAPFLRLAASGVGVGVMLHSFPSMIAAAERGLGTTSEPTAFELDAIAELGTAVLPGPHYAPLLAGRADVHVLEPGIDDTWRAPPRPRGERCALVSVGAVTPRKGFLDVVRVLEARPRRDDYQWTIVGSLEADVEYAREVEARASRLGTVTLVGQKSPDETRAIVQRANVLVMPSYDENHPLVLLEAIAASVPTVAYAAGAAAQILVSGGAGLVGPIGDRARLATNLERLIGDELEHQTMAQRCWAMQSTLRTWGEAAERARVMLSAAAATKRA
jgi:glycosyltransferase involved in cell wall biosynthesis